MDKNLLINALQRILNQYGVDVFTKRRFVAAALKDALAGNRTELKHILRVVNETDIFSYLAQGIQNKSEQSRLQQLILSELETECLMSKEYAFFFVETFCSAFLWKISISPPNSRQPAGSNEALPSHRTLTNPESEHKNINVTSTPNNDIGDIIIFGRHSGSPLQWRICDISADKKWAYILSLDILFQEQYNATYTVITWESCTIRNWLNTVFLHRFKTDEQQKIGIATLQNENNPWFKTSGGKDTKDRIFLPSLTEVIKYMGGNGSIARRSVVRGASALIDDRYNNDRIATFKNVADRWLLRTPGKTGEFVTSVFSSGCISVEGSRIHRATGGVRPALWLNISGKV